uniref:Putative secreted metalloprotease n=1 Tax=Haematobia irritans TaxID=7368 RepID=A0A1L8EDF8_HAEIR
MQITRLFTLLCPVVLTVLFFATPAKACSCLPAHPQEHYCTADYVALVRVMRKSNKLVPNKVVYKLQVKKSYKMNDEGQRTLRHGRIMSSDSESMCGVNLELGRLYVIAGRGNQLNSCQYYKEYKKMSIVERTGFTGAYKKGCSCRIRLSFGNRSSDKNLSFDECKWSPFSGSDCETRHSACFPSINRSFSEPVIKCRWRKTVSYDDCRSSN